jgi:hypothetical protein
MSVVRSNPEVIYSGRVFRFLTDAVEKSLAIVLALLLGGDFGLFLVGRCLIGEHQNRSPARFQLDAILLRSARMARSRSRYRSPTCSPSYNIWNGLRVRFRGAPVDLNVHFILPKSCTKIR